MRTGHQGSMTPQDILAFEPRLRIKTDEKRVEISQIRQM
jgi:hypothetical protein